MEINREFMTNNGSYPYNNPTHIVIHYTSGADGVTARANAIYYYNNGARIQCGTHYFLGDDGIYASTPESRGAWTNGNYQANTHAINIEVACGTNEPAFTDKEISLLTELVQDISNRHGIKPDNVIRHYDVCDRFGGSTVDPHKKCPRQYTDNAKWQRLREVITDMATAKENWEYQYDKTNNYSKDGKGTGNSSPNMYNFLAWTYENVVELKKQVENISTGGIDYAKLAKAVCDEQAKRMRE